MRKKFLLYAAVMGLSGITAQILLLRELLVSFYGNEFSIGIILANWLLLEAAGASLLGPALARARKNFSVFIGATILFSLAFPFSIYLARVFKNFLPTVQGQGLGISAIFCASFLSLLPSSLLHGALFTSCCELHNRGGEKSPGVFSVSSVYIFEAAGTLLGGITLSFLLLERLNSFEIAFLVAFLNFAACFFLLKGKRSSLIPALAAGAALFLLLGPGAGNLHLLTARKQWSGHELLEYRNTIYGNIAVTKRSGEYSFFLDGSLAITAPNPDITAIEEFAHIPLLSHPSPRDILVISGGAGGALGEIFKHGPASVDYAELDPAVLELLRKYPTELSESELSDKRLRVKYLDGRLFLKKTPRKYDVILTGFSDPSTLQVNRFFTEEFFGLAAGKLREGGILAFRLPGSLTYMNPEMRDMNASVRRALEKSFAETALIPGDGSHLYMASQGKIALSAEKMMKAANDRSISANLITRDYLDYKLNGRRLQRFEESLDGSPAAPNRDFRAMAVFYSVAHWNAMFDPGFKKAFTFIEKINMPGAASAAFFIFLLFAASAFLRKGAKPALFFSIFSTGFAGMLFDLMLIFAFQALYGYVFHWLGLLVTACMSGTVIGGLWMKRFIEKGGEGGPALLKLEAALALFALLLAALFLNESGARALLLPEFVLKSVFLLLSLASGLFIGAEFPLANSRYLKNTGALGGAAGVLYGADLLGGWLGGIAGALALLPVLGLAESSALIAFVKLLSFALLFFALRSRLSA